MTARQETPLFIERPDGQAFAGSTGYISGAHLNRQAKPLTFSVHCGDCLQVMPEIPDGSIDMVLCDLPYGTTACKWDSVIPFAALWAAWKRLLKTNGVIALTASQPFTSALVMSNPRLFKYEWIWVKNQPSGMALANRMPMKYHEVVCVFYDQQCTYNKQPASRGSEKAKAVVKNGVRGKHHTVTNGARLNVPDVRYYDPENVNPKSVLEFPCVPNGGGGRLHPTQKPEALMEYLIRTYTNEGDVVLDNCMGSGTTGVACVSTSRSFVGIEKDPVYFKKAATRIGAVAPALLKYNEKAHLLRASSRSVENTAKKGKDNAKIQDE